MNGIVRNSRGSGIGRAFAVLVAVGVSSAGGVQASAIHRIEMTAAEVKIQDEWSSYLKGGPAVWSSQEHPPVSPAIVAEVWHDVKTDPGGTDPMIAFLLWKQSIDPTRFAHYHPKLAPALHRIELARTSPTTTSQVVSPSGTPSTPPTTTSTPSTTSEPQNLIPSPSPEPSTLLIAAAMAAWSVTYVRGRRRRS